MKRSLLFLLLIFLFGTVRSQSDKKKAYELGLKAIEAMDAGHIDIARENLEKAQKLDPDAIMYRYEYAYTYSLEKDYKKAIRILKDLTRHRQVHDRVYQMLGNCYDFEGQPDKAIETYEEGLKKFPDSGPLYLERGNMELLANENPGTEDVNRALGYYEKGIEVDPAFPSNYYWATRIFLNSSEEVWGMVYGEIFMNLERNSKRTMEISKMLYDTYQSEIKRKSDNETSVSFSQNMVIDLDKMEKSRDLVLPFGMIYETTLLMSLPLVGPVNPENLDTIRTNFTRLYFEMDHHKTHPNILFDYQKKVMDAGHLEAYNRWIVMKGDEAAFDKWYSANTGKWEQFIAWFRENPLKVDEKHRFYRAQY